MKSVLVSLGGVATRVAVCERCGDLVRRGRTGGTCQNQRCRTWYGEAEIDAAVAARERSEAA